MHQEGTQPLPTLNRMYKKWAAQQWISRRWMAAAQHTILARLHSLSQWRLMHLNEMHTWTNFAIGGDDSCIKTHELANHA
jgi:hypothetical protein